MVHFHNGCALVERRECILVKLLEGVVLAAVVDIVAEAREEERKKLNVGKVSVELACYNECIQRVRHRNGVDPVVVWHVSVVVANRQNESTQRGVVDAILLNKIEVEEHPQHNKTPLLLRETSRRKAERIYTELLCGGNARRDEMLHDGVIHLCVVRYELKGNLRARLRLERLLIELCIVYGNAAVDGERLQHLIVRVVEGLVVELVDKLRNTDARVALENGHAENVPRLEASLIVDSAVEARVGIRIRNVERFSRCGHVTSNALVHRESNFRRRLWLVVSRWRRSTSVVVEVEYARIELSLVMVDEKDGAAVARNSSTACAIIFFIMRVRSNSSNMDSASFKSTRRCSVENTACS
eukprot:Opistho-2@93758